MTHPTVTPTEHGVPVYSWATDLEEGALQQAANVASLSCAHHHVSVMADGHQGYGVPIGAVVALKDHVGPYAVGNDIGCGMALVPTMTTGERLRAHRDDIMSFVSAYVPSGFAAHGAPDALSGSVSPLLVDAWAAMCEGARITGVALAAGESPKPEKFHALTFEAFLGRARSQMATLGSGNHFIEMLEDHDGRGWVMLHSGSRGVGAAICNNFHRMATLYCAEQGETLLDPGLAYLPLESADQGDWGAVGEHYMTAMLAALVFAEESRRRMLDVVETALHACDGSVFDWADLVNIHHNDAERERHYGADVIVHRKGAVKAPAGVSTVTPGSMGTGSFLGRGLGNAESFCSASHGAGRVLSRGRANRELNLDDQLAIVEAVGSKVYVGGGEVTEVHDEMPGAYKSLATVMENQADLIEAVEHFTPIATFKGGGGKRTRRGGRGNGGKAA